MKSIARLLASMTWAASLLVTAPVAAGADDVSSYMLVGSAGSLPSGLSDQIASFGGSITDVYPEIGIAIASSGDLAFAANASTIAGLQSVAKDATFDLDTGTVGYPPTSTDDDRFFNMQWALAAIHAPDAWNAGARGAGVRVAVLDTGIDVNHPDLRANLNLALSKSFLPGLPVAAPPGPPSFTAPPHHGTWVAGIIGAADNGVGVIGVAPQTELVALRVCPDNGHGCPSSAIIGALVYAAEHDTDVINMSLDFTLPRRGFTDATGAFISAAEVNADLVALTRALNFAHSHGATIVGIAGNKGADLDGDQDAVHLGQLPHVITAAATGPRGWGTNPATDLDLHACYSNYGTSAVDLAAPGGNFDCAQGFPPSPPYTFCRV
ncbi:MAG TPA: S8 family serine peptidase, partial [Candidatus Dormibacteraeota bacterium]